MKSSPVVEFTPTIDGISAFSRIEPMAYFTLKVTYMLTGVLNSSYYFLNR